MLGPGMSDSILAVFINSTTTADYYPLFEIISAVEAALLLFGIAILPFLACVAWIAQPLHRNIRLIFITCMLHALSGQLSRGVLIYAQYYIDDLNDYQDLLVSASFIRRHFVIFFPQIIIFFTIERAVATLCWSWYERQGRSTLVVFIVAVSVVECLALMAAYFGTFRDPTRSGAATAQRFIRLFVSLFFAAFGGIGYVVLWRYNKAQLAHLKKRRSSFDQYSLSRTYQLRENMIVIRMLARIAAPIVFVILPGVACFAAYLLLPHTPVFDLPRKLAVEMFDFSVAIVVVFGELRFTGFDSRFRTATARVPILRLLRRHRIGDKAHTKFVKQNIAVTEAQAADQYFNWLEGDLNGPK